MNHKKFIIGFIALNLLSAGVTWAELDEAPSLSKEIFPFEKNDSIYSEDFIEITDQGIFDSNGNTLQIINKEEKKPSEAESKDELSDLDIYQKTILNNWGSKKIFTQNRLNGIKNNLDEEKTNFVDLEKEIKAIETEFAPIRERAQNIKEQINLFNEQISFSKEKIKNTELLIAEKQIALKEAMWQLKENEIRLKSQEKAVLEYIEMVYLEEEKFLDYYTKSSSTLKLLLAENTINENLLGKEYATVMEKSGRELFYELYQQKIDLNEYKEDIEDEKQKLTHLHQQLTNEKRVLEEGKKSKKDLLEKTLGEEEKYQKLLEESIQQQLNSAIAIQNMKDNIDFIEGKLSILDESIVEVKEDENKTIEEIEILNEEIENEIIKLPEYDRVPDQQTFKWPVPPLAITAEFHDEHYPKKWGLHNAVDLRAKQYTEIRAPANGYVFQTKDNGMGYSYIILAHKNNIVTVYGHVSDILVKSGTVVKQGDLIGLSGGAIGTKGAGIQTTGPHLHFEVWKNGVAVDPLDYLPLHELPLEQIPEKYLRKLN